MSGMSNVVRASTRNANGNDSEIGGFWHPMMGASFFVDMRKEHWDGREPSKAKKGQWTYQHLGTQPGDIQEQAEPPGSRDLGVPAQNPDRRPSVNRKNTSTGFGGDAAQLKTLPPLAIEKPSLPLQTDLRRQDSDQPSKSQVCLKEERAATQVFSMFDHGPSTGQPAFIPDNSLTTPRSVSPIDPGLAAPEKEIDGVVSLGGTAPLASPMEAIPVLDRWAQIKKNAAERAEAAPKENNEYTRSDIGDSVDDGEISDEETMESRVARIKARVAELLGNLDTTTRV